MSTELGLRIPNNLANLLEDAERDVRCIQEDMCPVSMSASLQANRISRDHSFIPTTSKPLSQSSFVSLKPIAAEIQGTYATVPHILNPAAHEALPSNDFLDPVSETPTPLPNQRPIVKSILAAMSITGIVGQEQLKGNKTKQVRFLCVSLKSFCLCPCSTEMSKQQTTS